MPPKDGKNKKASQGKTNVQKNWKYFYCSFNFFTLHLGTFNKPPEPTSTPSSSKTTSQPSTPESSSTQGLLVGYIQDVSPTKVSKKGSEYFSFHVQQKDRVVKAVSFSPKKHKLVVESKAEIGVPCKITKFSPHATEKDTIWINPNTQINEALETSVDFSKDDCKHAPEIPVCQTADLDDIQIHQSITIKGYIVFGDRQAEKIPSKKDLIKREGCLVDERGNVPITLWNDHIKSISSGFYEVKGVRLRQYLGKKYVSTSADTLFTKISKDPPPSITSESIQVALDSLKLDEIKCDDKISGADVQEFYTCINCAKKVLYQQEPMLRCGKCQVRFLVKNAKKITAVRLNVDNQWYTLFTSSLETILQHHNKTQGQHEMLGTIDDDKLCDIVLNLKGLKLKIINDNKNVVDVAFDPERVRMF